MIAATVNTDVVELSFKGRRRELYLNADHLEYRTGEYLIVQADRGEDIGVVVLSSHPMTLVPVGKGALSGPSATPAPTGIEPGEGALPGSESGSAGPPAGHSAAALETAPPPAATRSRDDRGGKDGHHQREGRGNRPEVRPNQLKRIVRRATMDEIARVADLREKEDTAARTARSKVLEHKLDMKLVDVEYQFDGNRITFYFTAEQRVDFRDLVKDLAGIFRTRIELRQIGVRDESGRLGGVGVCGRPLCCTTWIREFAPITLKMAKEQNLSLSPSKLSGVCGRLKCCLRYEIDFYQQAQKTYPRLGAQLTWNNRPMAVVKVDIFKEGVWLLDDDRETHWVALTEMPEISREDRLSFKKKKSAGGQGGCGNVNAGGCGAGRGEARSGGGCGSGGACGSGGGCGTGGAPRSASSGGGCGTGRPRFQPRDPRRAGGIGPGVGPDSRGLGATTSSTGRRAADPAPSPGGTSEASPLRPDGFQGRTPRRRTRGGGKPPPSPPSGN
jgi:cell fate regulator YaaT (PSP1 superfamily)